MPEQFVNTFNKGLNSDYQILYQPEGTYRYLRNCQLISQDGNNYAIKDCLGNTVMFTLNPPYDAVYTVVGRLPMALAFISFPDKLIVISTNYDGTNGTPYMEIGKLEYLPYGQGIQPKTQAGQYNAGYIPLYHHLSLNGNLNYRIEGFAFTENELVERIYFTDNNNEPRVFNVSDPIFTTYYTATAGIGDRPVVNGTTYMVLEGAIEYNGVRYGPGLTPGTNIFTANATNTYTILTGATPTPKVVQYYPYQLLNWTPDRMLGGIQFSSYGSGNVLCGSKVYFYRLITSDGSYATTWSYGSSPIHVGTENDPDLTGILAYHNFVGGGSLNTTLDSGKSVYVKIDNIDTNYGFIELACAEYDNLSDVPRLISAVNRMTITGSTMTIQHTGNTNLGEFTIGDITLFPASILKVKTLATNKNYNLIGNLTERQEFDIDLSGVTCTSFEYPMNVHSDPDSCSLGGMIYSGAFPDPAALTANPAANTITPWSRWLVLSGTAIYDGNNYTAGEVITGTGASGSIDTTTNPGTEVRPCVTRNRYTTGGNRVENAIPLTTGFWTYKDPAVHNHALGYWSGETYRYGILFFDLKGNPYFVKWLADYTFPTLNDKGGSLISDNNFASDPVYSLNPSGIKFSNLSIPADLIDTISGFSIVRAERDPIIVTQGLVMQCGESGASPNVYKPSSWITMAADEQSPADKIYTYLCPDSLVDAPLKASFGQNGDTMQLAEWLDCFSYSGIPVRASGGTEQVYTKLIDVEANDAFPISDRTRTITYFGFVDVNGQLSNLLSAGDVFQNAARVDPAAGAAANVNGACISSGTYNLQGYEMIGCKKIVFSLDDDFPAYNTTDPYTSVLSGPEELIKLRMNYLKSGKTIANLYGGTGDEAKANTLYISTGHFQPITAQVKTDTYNGSDAYVFNDIEVFGGDCYTSLIDIGYGLWRDSYANKFSYAWTFPCECNSNYDLRRGRKTSNVEMFYTGLVEPVDNIVFESPTNVINLENYVYNQGYSTEGQTIRYPALPVNYVNAGQFETRIRYAGEKFLGELIDSFRTFRLADLKDLPGQNGFITNIKVKDDRVFVWQLWSVNTVPILERQVISSTSGDETTIGTGGVVDRVDIVSSYFGNQHQWSVVETEYGFAWFDMHRKAFVTIGLDGTGMVEVSLVNGLQGFFNEVFVEADGNQVLSETNLLNSPTFSDTSDRPLMGIGIHGVYDPKNKMTYLNFKFKARKKVGSPSVDAYLTKDFTIGYLHTRLDRMFVGFFDWFPSIAHNHNQWVFSSNNPKNTTQYLPLDLTSYIFAVGETLQGVEVGGVTNNSEYINILPVTLSDPAFYPLGASGATYWRLINSTNQVWAHNQPRLLGQTIAPDYLYNSFFGRIVDNELSMVINPPQGADNTFTVSNMEQLTPTNINYTSVYTQGNNGQNAQDVNISATNVNYRYVFDKILSSFPRMSNGAKIFSNYLLVTFVKHNWTTDPTVATLGTKILQRIRSFFTFHR